MFVMMPIACITEPGYAVIGAGIKDTIPHEQYNQVSRCRSVCVGAGRATSV